MSTLPPYSTFRTDSKQMMYPQATSHGNILTFTPPGFTQSLNIKFPDSRLAVCEKCKRNFKTKDMCRVRNSHTEAPWSTAYICVTVDASCTDENNKFLDKPMTVRMVQWQPFQVKKPFDSKTPVCSSCKRTNRTRGFCRDRHKHTQLPWCTVYVLLSAVESTDPATIVAGESQKVDDDNSSRGNTGTPTAPGKEPAESPSSCEKLKAEDSSTPGSLVGSETITSEAADESDDINDVPESRTFLAKVSSAGCSVHWLAMGEGGQDQSYSDRGADSAVPPQMPPGAVDQHQLYYAQQYAHHQQQQHQQHQLKSQQFFYHMQQQQAPPQYQQPIAPQPPRHAAYPQGPGTPTWYAYPTSPAAAPGPTNGDPMSAGEAAAARQRSDDAAAAAAHQHAWAAHYYQQQQQQQQQMHQHHQQAAPLAIAGHPHALPQPPTPADAPSPQHPGHHPHLHHPHAHHAPMPYPNAAELEEAYHTPPESADRGHDDDSVVEHDAKRQRTSNLG